MNLTICDNLKELRKKKNNTQEDLADFLTVSIAAVSKWERGECYPDIELLPKIAAYYGISIDDLLGFGEIRKKERIKEYEEKSNRLCCTGDRKADLELMREAHKEFPNDWLILNKLMWAMSYYEQEKNAQEIIKIGEKILAECTIDNYRYGAMDILCCTYALVLKDNEKAREYAKMAPPYYWTYNALAPMTYRDGGEEAIKFFQKNIFTLVNHLDFNIDNYRHAVLKDKESQRRALQIILKLYELMYENGDYHLAYQRIANWYDSLARLSRSKEETLENLSNAVKYAIKYDSLGDIEQHTSFLVNRLSFERNDNIYSSADMSTGNVSFKMLNNMNDSIYDFCRDDETFIKLIEDLKKVAVSG